MPGIITVLAVGAEPKLSKGMHKILELEGGKAGTQT